MCGRFAQFNSLSTLREASPFEEVLVEPAPSWNVGPTQGASVVAVVGGRSVLTRFTWGFPGVGARILINARLETLSEKWTFKHAFATHRCVVPVDGWYEWYEKIPHFFHHPDGKGMALAALWEEEGTSGRFVVVTRPAEGVAEPVHSRMPLALTPDGSKLWLRQGALAPEACASLCRSHTLFPSVYTLSNAVNRISENGPHLLVPTKRHRQQALFE